MGCITEGRQGFVVQGCVKMGIKIHRSWASENPSGVIINPGWYALAEAICTTHTTCTVLQKWCGVSESRGWTKKDTSCSGEKMKKIIKIYRRNKGKLPHSVIAERVGCTREYVSIVLKKKLGIGKRNRWEGYISKDPRYSIEKRRALENAKTVRN